MENPTIKMDNEIIEIKFSKLISEPQDDESNGVFHEIIDIKNDPGELSDCFEKETEKETEEENDESLMMEICYDEIIEELDIWDAEVTPEVDEDTAVTAFLSKECCKRKCNSKFDADEIILYRLELLSIDYNEHGINQLDLVLLGLIHSLCRVSDEIRHSRYVVKEKRKRLKMMFSFRGVSVCRAMFLFAHAIKIERLKRLLKRYKHEGLTPKPHGNYKRIPANAITTEQVNEVVSFLKNYAKENGSVIPGRMSFQNSDMKLLPPTETKLQVYKKFKQSCGSKDIISVVSFRRLWNKFCPDIVIQRSESIKPSTSQKTKSSDTDK